MFLSTINTLNISRYILLDYALKIELHGFADASEKAYGAAIYVRCLSNSGEISTNLLCSKSRIAPLKSVTILRLELCAAVLLEKLAQKTITSMKISFHSTVLWTDSTIVLAWIQKDPSVLKPFVRNRVSAIQNLTEISAWKHVPSKENRADIISRGIDPEKIQDCNLWWFGPSFLQDHSVVSPCVCSDINDNELYQREFKKTPTDPVCLVVQGQEMLPIINNCSSFTRLQRVIGWIKRGQQLPNSSSLINLSPFLDEEDILRVGGRLKNSNLPIERKHPILLPYNNHFSDLIINHFHVLYLHTGAEATLANIRTKFWLIDGRNYIRKIIRKCVPCLKVSAKSSNQVMADLPSCRVNISRVFTRVGIDFCGPFSIKLLSGRFKKSYKCYICIFICFVVKSVHLEIVNSCSTDAFIGALKRFIARRGKPSDIYSDNGTNFVGANNELRKILKDLFNKESTGKIEDFIASEGIVWHFNPPATPHFGGLWEAGVKSLKSHLKRVVGNTVLTHEEFSTLVTQVEAVLNSRPLCNLSSDLNDVCDFVLTPAHFLVGSSLTALPDPDLTEVPISRLNRWQLVQRLSQIFWRKWSTDYLNRLQSRVKWRKGEKIFKENEIELVKNEDNSKKL
ncbi:hypothetical protein AVEN_185716-1 [Araneus ventricosus]|uniref:Integrase catalytic domain-containing protein n=1 Tax=Araneus ventricosus TaxID=182803 RepID=A0A4Y2VWD7_ARAVE|nr:hypothetical protein AVEN_93271-1 [Araneus ventricosus]GBO28683.1 hypothetical protein AVEN_166256-1 [Araneus ventricosus]GBO28688.1 hypothetical protein AVEN_180243-1 [Araneus ventricosus]GBO28689.1 hypothetical protein AVEN_185716-1 [Araneus ventricosus]